MNILTYLLIALILCGLFSYARKQIKQKENNMNSQEFTMKMAPILAISIIVSGGFMLSVGVYSCLLGTADDSLGTGLFMGGFGLVALFIAMCFNAIKIKVDQQTIQSFNLFRRKPLIINFNEIALAKYEETGNSAVLKLYNADNKKLLRVESTMVGFSLLVERVRAINCEFVDKSKQPKK